MKLFFRCFSAAALVFLLTGCGGDDSTGSSSKSPLKFNFPNPPSEVKTKDGVVVGSLKTFNLEIKSSDPITVSVYSQSGCKKAHSIGNAKIDKSNSTISIDLGDLKDGTYKFHYTTTKSESVVSSCIKSEFVYELDTSIETLGLAFAPGFSTPSNNRNPSFRVQGDVEDGASVTLHDGVDCSGDEISITVSGNKITPSLPTGDRNYEFRLKHTDSVGNYSCSVSALDYELETQPPVALTLSLPTGVTSPNKNANPAFIVGGDIETGATVTLHNGTDCSSAKIPSNRHGNVISVEFALVTNTTYNFHIKHIDEAGNFSCSATALDYELDTKITTLTLSFATGTTSPSDDTTPSFVIGGVIETGATVTLHDGSDCSGDDVGHTLTNNDITLTALTTNKTYDFRIKHTDGVGNTSCSNTALSYKLDTDGPTALTLSFATGLTSPGKDASPSLLIGGAIETGATITLHDGGDCTGAAIPHISLSNIIVVNPALTVDKTYNFRLKHTDGAGNASCSAAALPYKLDTTPPVVLSIALDGITSPNKETTPTFAITGVIEANASLTLYDGSGCTGTEIGIGAPSSNKVTISTALTTNKTYNFHLKHTDEVGNSSCSTALPYKLDTAPPVALTLSFAAGVTTPSNDTTPSLVIGGVIESGAEVTLHDGADCSGAEVTHTRTNSDISVSTLTTDKTYNFRVKHADEAGNVSCSAAALDYKLDTTAPVALSIALDGITSPNNETTPTFAITGTIEANASLTLYDGSGCTGTEIGIGAPASNKITVSTALSEGTYSFWLKHTDEAGNSSCSAAGVAYVLDTTAPAILSVSLSSGVTTPNTSTTPLLLINGVIESNGSATLHSGSDCSGTSIDFEISVNYSNATGIRVLASAGLSVGAYSFRIKHTDEAGNESCSTSGRAYTIIAASSARSTADHQERTPVPSIVSAVKQVVPGQEHNCALFENGQVKCWGENSDGQLGYGDTNNRGDASGEMGDDLEFINLGTDSAGNPYTARAISLGQDHTCAILSTGDVKCWGRNSDGQLGYGDTNNRGDDANEMGNALEFINLGTDDTGNPYTARAISLGQDHTCAIFNTGDVKCWGKNSDGQLGYGDTNNRGDDSGEMGNDLEFINLGTDDDDNPYTAKAISLEQNQTCATLNNDDVKCWGENSDE